MKNSFLLRENYDDAILKNKPLRYEIKAYMLIVEVLTGFCLKF